MLVWCFVLKLWFGFCSNGGAWKHGIYSQCCELDHLLHRLHELWPGQVGHQSHQFHGHFFPASSFWRVYLRHLFVKVHDLCRLWMHWTLGECLRREIFNAFTLDDVVRHTYNSYAFCSSKALSLWSELAILSSFCF